jgi:dihydroorotate dehydrogenase
LFLAFSYLYITDTRASVHQWLVVPVLRWLYPDAEDAHHIGTEALKTLYTFGIHPRERGTKYKGDKQVDLGVEVFGHRLSNPIGISAGLDKSADIPDALFALGPSIVEVGGVTPFPQDGNARPRVFRLPREEAIINRYGLNSLGAENMAMRLRERVRLFAYNRFGIEKGGEDFVLDGGAGVPPGSLADGKILIVQVAKNKWTKDDDISAVTKDFVAATNEVAQFSDIVSVNVSSPNTPGLRTLQRVEPLTKILEGVVGAAKSVKRRTPPKVMVKVSPDEDTEEQIRGIVEAVWRSGVDGIIVGNTTKRRSNLVSADMTARERQILDEQGGYSGPQMYERTLGLVKRYRHLLDQGPSASQESEQARSAANIPAGDEPASNIVEKTVSTKESATNEGGTNANLDSHKPKVIFATGGVTNGKQALELLNAGASVVQVYTAIIYGGVGTVSRIKREMRDNISGG